MTKLGEIMNSLKFNARGVLFACVLFQSAIAFASDKSAVDAARKREARVKSIEIVFNRTEVIEKGAISEQSIFRDSLRAQIPSSRTVLKSVNKLVIHGDKIRYENNHPMYQMPTGIVVTPNKICLFNGDIARGYFPKGVSGKTHPEGVIGEHAYLHDVKSFELTPLTMTIRGINPGFCPYPAHSLKFTGVRLPIKGSVCDEYAVQASKTTKIRFWLNPSADYALIRTRKDREHKLIEQTDVSYSDDSNDLIPVRWVNSRFGTDGKLRIENTIEIVSSSVNNKDVDESQFEMQFPVDSRVYDNRVGKEYYVQTDGSLREIYPDGTLKESVAFQPGASIFLRHKWLIIISLSALALTIIGLLINRKRMKNKI